MSAPICQVQSVSARDVGATVQMTVRLHEGAEFVFVLPPESTSRLAAELISAGAFATSPSKPQEGHR